MSDRYKAFVVVFERDIDEGHMRMLTHMIMEFRGVLEVQPLVANRSSDIIAEVRVRNKVHEAIVKVLYPERFGYPAKITEDANE